MSPNDVYLEHWLSIIASIRNILLLHVLTSEERLQAYRDLHNAEIHVEAFFEASANWVKAWHWVCLDEHVETYSPTTLTPGPDDGDVGIFPEEILNHAE